MTNPTLGTVFCTFLSALAIPSGNAAMSPLPANELNIVTGMAETVCGYCYLHNVTECYNGDWKNENCEPIVNPDPFILGTTCLYEVFYRYFGNTLEDSCWPDLYPEHECYLIPRDGCRQYEVFHCTEYRLWEIDPLGGPPIEIESWCATQANDDSDAGVWKSGTHNVAVPPSVECPEL